MDGIVAQLRANEGDFTRTGPAVITIEGPWGSGKTTMMDLVRQRLLAANGPTPAEGGQRGNHLTVREAIRYLRQPPGSVPKAPVKENPVSGHSVITAWLNPWAHQSGQQIWAGLTSAIIEAAQPVICPTEPQRERYWFDRNLNRVDRHVLRSTLLRRVLSPVLGIALVTGILPLMVSLLESGKSVRFLGLPVNAATLALVLPAAILVAGLLHTLARYWRGLAISYLPAELFNGPFSEATGGDGSSTTLADPLRRAARGSLYLHQHDVKIVLNDLSVLGYDLVVFIDDLDRCTAATAAEMFEAINLFLSGIHSEGLSARFVIGIDSSVIAAHLDHIYSGLNVAEVARQGEDPSIGWTYLRKLVQLPVIVPRLSGDTIVRFINAASGLPNGNSPHPAQPTVLPPAVHPPREAAARTHQVKQPVPAGQSPQASPAALAEQKHRAAAKVIPWQTMEQHPLVRELMHERLSSQPDVTVREAKRLINVWQLYSRILMTADPLDIPATLSRARTMVILAEILVRWPALQRYLLQRVGGQIALRKLADTAREEKAWTALAGQLGMDVNYHHAALSALRDLLEQYDEQEIADLAEKLF